MKTLMHKLVTLCIAAAICAVATSAMAAVNNLESYLFRFDFSKGANEFSSSPSYADFNLVGANTAPTNGPNGVSSAATITANAWKAFTSGSVLNADGWTIATSLSVANVNNACVFSVGRLTTPNTGGAKKTLAICTTDATDRLLVRFVYRTSSGYSCTEKVMSGLGDITRGFHTLVIKYEYTDNGSGNKGTLTLYWDGENKRGFVHECGSVHAMK